MQEQEDDARVAERRGAEQRWHEVNTVSSGLLCREGKRKRRGSRLDRNVM